MIEPAYLTGDGLVLRPYDHMDIDPHCEAAVESVDEIYPWLFWCKPGYTRAYSEAWIETRAREWEQGTSYDFCITDTADGTLLGATAVNHIDHENRFGNLGYWVRTSRAGQGVATAAARLTVQFGVETLRLTRIEIVVAVGNDASRRVAEKLGARCEGVLRNRLMTSRGLRDAVMYSLVPDDIAMWE